MTTRKQVMDAYKARVADDQQRAANGQFGSGGGKSVNITHTPEAQKATQTYLQKQASESGRQARFSNGPAGMKTHLQNVAAQHSKAERKARGVEDACKGIKGILDALAKA